MWLGFRRRSPEAQRQYEKHRRWDAFRRLFDPHRHLRYGKALLGRTKRAAVGMKYQKIGKESGLITRNQEFSNAQTNSQVNDGNSSSGMLSDSTYTKSLELQMKQHKMPKLLPISPARLIRTLSIHHLECDYYVQSDGMVPENDEVAPSSHDVGSLKENDQIHLESRVDIDDKTDKHGPLREISALLFEKQKDFYAKLNGANVTDRDGDISGNEARKSMHTMETFHANREKLLKVIQGPNCPTADSIWDPERTGAHAILSRSTSCPGAGFVGGGSGIASNRKMGIGSFVVHNGKLQSEAFSVDKGNLLEINQEDVNNAEPQTRKLTSIHQRTDTEKRIILDGVLDKIPVNKTKEVSISGRYYRKGGFSSGRTALENSQMRRSRSLSDSVDSYSHFLEPNVVEDIYGPASDSSIHGVALQAMQSSSKSLGRIHSLPDYQVYSLEVTPNHDCQSIMQPRMSSNHASSAISYSYGYKSPLETIIPVCEDPSEVTYIKDLLPRCRDNDEVTDFMYKPVDVAEDELNDELEIVSEEDIRNMFCDQETGSENEHASSKVIKQNLSSETHSYGDVMSAATASFPEGPMPNMMDSLEDTTAADAHDGRDNSDMLLVRRQSLMEFDVGTLHNEVRSKDIANFNYVMDILKRSGFRTNELRGRWHSPELPLDPSVFRELEGISSETEICSCFVDLNLDNLLLFDMTNDVLLEIFETNFIPNLWTLRSPSCIWRPYEGLIFFKEVWVNISRHLSSQPQVNLKTDDLVSWDFKRNASWMNLNGIEGIGTDLSKMILDDVLDESLHELLN